MPLSLIYPKIVGVKESVLFNYFDPQYCTQCPIAVQSAFGFATVSSPQTISLSIFLESVIDKATGSLVIQRNKIREHQNFTVTIISVSCSFSKRSAYGTDFKVPLFLSVFKCFPCL